MHSIFSIGHSNHPAERLVELLRLHAVDVLVDVRSQPYSRFAPQFNRENLEPVVTRAGLRYLFLGEELGGRQLGKIPTLAERLDAYEQVAASPQFKRGIERVLAGAETYRIALLCAEEDPTECHRRVWVCRALREAGASVQHIRGDGHLDADEQLKRLEPPAGRQLGLFDS
ncbi:MAG: DUF488 domain-containing protein [Chloroflexota bacterium]